MPNVPCPSGDLTRVIRNVYTQDAVPSWLNHRIIGTNGELDAEEIASNLCVADHALCYDFQYLLNAARDRAQTGGEPKLVTKISKRYAAQGPDARCSYNDLLDLIRLAGPGWSVPR